MKNCSKCKQAREENYHRICYECNDPSFPDLEGLKSTDWEYSPSKYYKQYELRHEGASLLIEARNHYCDRGHWSVKVFGIPSIDAADSFPRFFMNLETAKREMKEWLIWRLYKETPYDDHIMGK
jgi:hypothetical protein